MTSNILHAFNIHKHNGENNFTLVLSQKKLAPIISTLFNRKYYGILPIAGYIPNVRAMDQHRIKNNTDIQNIMDAIGLEIGSKHDDKNLNYNSVLIATHYQDNGYFIGLIINFFHYFWPELLQIKNFIFSVELEPCSGTLQNFVTYHWSDKILPDGTNVCDDAIKLQFSPEYYERRKEVCTKKPIIKNKEFMSYSSFMKTKLANYCCQQVTRSMPSIIDGLRPSQREIFKTLINMQKNNYSKITIQEISGEILKTSENNYDHNSICDNIITMANHNIPLMTIKNFIDSKLYAKQYVDKKNVIKLGPYHNVLFNENDNLNPIIPLSLVNKCVGISYGYSTHIYPCHPIEVCDNLIRLLSGQDVLPMSPYVDTSIKKINNVRYLVMASYDIIDDYTINITKLPLNVTSQDYLNFLDHSVSSNKLIKSYSDKCTYNNINIKIKLEKPINSQNEYEIIKDLKLSTVINLKDA